jgi:hypothetical protein
MLNELSWKKRNGSANKGVVMFSVLTTIIEVLQKIPSFLSAMPSVWAAIMSSPKWLKTVLLCSVFSALLGVGLLYSHHLIYNAGYAKAKVDDATMIAEAQETMRQMLTEAKKDTSFVQIPVTLPKPKPLMPIAGTVEMLSDSIKVRIDSVEAIAKTEHEKYLVADSLARVNARPWTSKYEDSVQNLSMKSDPMTHTTLASITYKVQFPLVPQITITLAPPRDPFYKSKEAHVVYGVVGTTVVYFIIRSLVK